MSQDCAAGKLIPPSANVAGYSEKAHVSSSEGRRASLMPKPSARGLFSPADEKREEPRAWKRRRQTWQWVWGTADKPVQKANPEYGAGVLVKNCQLRA